LPNLFKKASIDLDKKENEIQGMKDRTNAAISKTGFSPQFRRYSMDIDAINVSVTETK
jgi:hypothetical protein